ncbi:hypothetical protein FPOAC1_003897 [Fusarium poae]|uniref:hypothetical protein n=1 Tax=Fusarium poae TaxID=36050 RepID=UPI001CE968A0|nr:hypothetical protein FPOAC1_003897 [Fusarium poae]KAG8677869.1 hypothetical protein FPOAC1_003897 [Fusarium poae]
MAEALGVASSVIAVVELSEKVFSLCLKYVDKVKNAKNDIQRLCKEVVTFLTTTRELQALVEGPRGNELKASQHLKSAIEDSRLRLEILEKQLQLSTGRNGMGLFAISAHKWAFKSKEVKETIEDLERCRGTISSALTIDQTTILQNVNDRTTLNQLPIAHGASFDSKAGEHNPTCLPDTREELLKEIDCWIDNPTSKTIFWLNGMAGTGKSTISRTVAHSRSKRGDLGASFFFKRGERDRDNLNKVMSTLAYQLAFDIQGAAIFIKKTLDDNPAIVGKSTREQFQKLIQEPLSEAAAVAKATSPVVVVIDALDECDQEADIRLLINILSQAKTPLPHLRVFLTSRPELPIRLGFSQVQGSYQNLVLHDIPPHIVKHDIVVFLNAEFEKIRDDFNMTVSDERKLPSDWPGHPIVQSLAQMAVPLFIFAATVCRFVGDRNRNSPSIQLRKVLDYQSKGHVSQLDLTYGPVLRSFITGVSGDDKKQIINNFKMIIGGIVMLADPLSARALSQLLKVDPEVVDNRLDTLHSVLNIPPTRNAPVRLLHLSFRDYLIKEKSEFQVDERCTHQMLAKHCLRIMRGALRKNICGLSFPGMRRSAVDLEQLEKSMPSQVQYACMHWAYHQTEGDSRPNDDKEIYDFLTTKFLHWVEAMSLLGRAKECLDSLRLLARWVENQKDSRLSTFVADAVRFVQIYFSVIAEAPLQIYCCLAFTPSKSVVRMRFEYAIPRWISALPKVEANWDACLLTLEGHSSWVNSVVFSHDSKKVASGSHDKTIRIWDAETGECERELKGHTGHIYSVVFSHDSKKVASGSDDKTIRIWDVETGECERELEGDTGHIYSVVLSHDSKKVASGSDDKTIRIWDAETGECERELKGHTSYIYSVVFSHDSKKVASGSHDETIRIWDVETGECERELEGDTDWVSPVVFSHDSKKVASGSYDKTIRIWDAETGGCACEPDDDYTDDVYSVVFSHDSKKVALGSVDGMIPIWDAETGECEQELKGHTGHINSVVFSHDSKKVASGCCDGMIRIWDAETGECERVLGGHAEWVTSMVLSHDWKKVVLGYYDGMIRTWDVETGECERELKGHTGHIYSVVFSHDSKKVASGSDDKTIRIWDAETGECERVLKGHTGHIYSVVLSHDSKKVASGSDDKTIRIWDAETGECERELKGHTNCVNSMVFSHDSKKVASGSGDKTIRIWDAEAGECEDLVSLHVYAGVLSFTLDGRGIVTDCGTFPLTCSSQSRPGSAMPWQSSHAPMLACTDSTWVTAAGKDLLWLPPECRGGKVAVSGSRVVINCLSGRVLVLGISMADMEQWMDTTTENMRAY